MDNNKFLERTLVMGIIRVHNMTSSDKLAKRNALKSNMPCYKKLHSIVCHSLTL